MRRDNVRVVLNSTKEGDIFTTRELAKRTGFRWQQISGALKYLHGICIEVFEDLPKKPRKWIRTRYVTRGKAIASMRLEDGHYR